MAGLFKGTAVHVEFGDVAIALGPSGAHTISRSFPHTFRQPIAHFLRATAKVHDAQIITELPAVSLLDRSEIMVVDVGVPADWVKKHCYEVYALVPGHGREEVRVQSDPGRLVISGQPEQQDNPWGVTPFKKVVSLPTRIDPHHSSVEVTLHGQLFVRVPFEQADV